MTIVSTKKVFLAADQKTLVEPDDKRAAFLFAVPGQRIDEATLKGLTNVNEFFSEAVKNLERESAEEVKRVAGTLTESKRVVPEPEPSQHKAAKIVAKPEPHKNRPHGE
jgi:hypothetical protein